MSKFNGLKQMEEESELWKQEQEPENPIPPSYELIEDDDWRLLGDSIRQANARLKRMTDQMYGIRTIQGQQYVVPLHAFEKMKVVLEPDPMGKPFSQSQFA